MGGCTTRKFCNLLERLLPDTYQVIETCQVAIPKKRIDDPPIAAAVAEALIITWIYKILRIVKYCDGAVHIPVYESPHICRYELI